jgi:hypothetical protein
MLASRFEFLKDFTNRIGNIGNGQFEALSGVFNDPGEFLPVLNITPELARDVNGKTVF